MEYKDNKVPGPDSKNYTFSINKNLGYNPEFSKSTNNIKIGKA